MSGRFRANHCRPGQSRRSAPQCGLRLGRCPSLLTLLRTIPRSQWRRAPSPEEEDGYSAAQSSKGRCREIHKFRVPAGRELLQILKYPRVDPKAPNDPNGAPVQSVPRHCDRAGPGIGRDIKRAGKAGSHHVLPRQQGQKTEEADANPRDEAE
jgi:hypothetical protein